MFWYGDLEDLTEEELLEDSRKLYRKALEAEITAKGFNYGYKELRRVYVHRVFVRNGIRHKSRCRTPDGLVGVFDSIDGCGNIAVCLLGASGKPYKRPHIYGYDVADEFKPEEKQ